MRLNRGDVVLVLFPDSVIMTDNLATVLETEMDRVIGHHSQMQAVDAALRHTLGV